MTLQVFQAVTLNTSAYQPHALLMRILSAEGPSILREYFRPRAHNKSHRQLGLVQIRIALQEVCGQSQIKQQARETVILIYVLCMSWLLISRR